MTLSPAFADALAAGRPRLNAQVAEARRRQRGFDLDALRWLLAERLDPIVAAVAAVAPERTRLVAEAGFGFAVTLAAGNLAGAGGPAERCWDRIGGRIAPALAERPALLGLLTNAALRIARTPGARLDEWLARMYLYAKEEPAGAVPAIGQLAAWVSGMAHYQIGALAAGDALPETTALALVGAPNTAGGWPAVRGRLAADPWWKPLENSAGAGHVVGGFAGFGGGFVAIPELRVLSDAFVLRSNERHFLLVANAFGAVLLPASADEFAAGEVGAVPIGDGGVEAGDRLVPLDLPVDGLAAAATATTLALVSRYSYAVRVMPWRLA